MSVMLEVLSGTSEAPGIAHNIVSVPGVEHTCVFQLIRMVALGGRSATLDDPSSQSQQAMGFPSVYDATK